MQLWPDLSDYYKVNVLFPFVDHWLQEVDSRFSQRCNEHWALTVSIDNIPWSNWNSQLLTKNPYYEGILPFLSRGSKVEKFFEIIPLEERAATANSDWTAGCLQPSDISSYSQDLYHSSYYPGKCSLWTFFFCSTTSQDGMISSCCSWRNALW